MDSGLILAVHILSVALAVTLTYLFSDKLAVLFGHEPDEDFWSDDDEEDGWLDVHIRHHVDAMMESGSEIRHISEELPNGTPVLVVFFTGDTAVTMAEDLDLVDPEV